MFTREIEDALAEGRVHLAVHSLKDLPTDLPAGFALAATPPRVDPRDVFVSARFDSLANLPQGSKVGTSSQRRRAQLRALRPDLELLEFRGNVDTRLRKLSEGQVDAILLAAAGLDRLEKTDWIRERLEPAQFCPAAGQGSLGIETRDNDTATHEALAFLDDAATRYAVTVERAALAALGGGCQVPIGVHCRPDSKDSAGVELFAVVASPDSGKSVRIHHRAPNSTDPAALGRLLAQMLFDAGAATILPLAATAVTPE